MKHENIARLIETSDGETLKQVARLALELSGYADSRISDGPYDGGVDLVVANSVGAALPLGIAVSVEKNWKKKIREGADKARRKLELQKLLFVSSRRIPEGSFRTVQAELRDEIGVDVDRLDQQGIADLVMDHSALHELIAVFGLPIDREHLPARPSDRRRDLAYAYAFFAPEVHSFRKSVRDRGLLVALAQAGGKARVDELCEDACRLLGMDTDEATSLRHDLDRLRGHGRVEGGNGAVALAPGERDTMDALRALRRREEVELRDALRAHVDDHGLGSPDEVLELINAWSGRVAGSTPGRASSAGGIGWCARASHDRSICVAATHRSGGRAGVRYPRRTRSDRA